MNEQEVEIKIQALLEYGVSVVIYKTNELNKDRFEYVVASASEPDFWLSCFSTRVAAKAYCRSHLLPIVELTQEQLNEVGGCVD